VALVDYNREGTLRLAAERNGLAVSCDVSDAMYRAEAIDKIVATLAALRILINCAGVAPSRKMLGRTRTSPSRLAST